MSLGKKKEKKKDVGEGRRGAGYTGDWVGGGCAGALDFVSIFVKEYDTSKQLTNCSRSCYAIIWCNSDNFRFVFKFQCRGFNETNRMANTNLL